VASARAACFEGYVAAVRDAERSASLATWDYPACVIPLAEGEAAIACGHPDGDGEALAAWAARVATKLGKAGVRRVVLAGSPRAKEEVEAAVTLLGVRVATQPRRSWLPWRR
jgi:hypothetical protein